MEEARLATEDDLDAVATLARAALAEMAPVRGGHVFTSREGRAEPVDESLRMALAGPDHCVLAGTLDGTVLGYAVARVEALRTGEGLGVIEDLYVDPEARGVGLGEAMMDALLQWFTERKVAGVDAMALPGDRSTKNFFETAGFSARLLVMHHRMPG